MKWAVRWVLCLVGAHKWVNTARTRFSHGGVPFEVCIRCGLLRYPKSAVRRRELWSPIQ